MDFYHSPVAVWVNSAPQPKRWGPRAHRGNMLQWTGSSLVGPNPLLEPRPLRMICWKCGCCFYLNQINCKSNWLLIQKILLSHVTHICIGNCVISGLDISYAPNWCKVIIQTNSDISSVRSCRNKMEIPLLCKMFYIRKFYGNYHPWELRQMFKLSRKVCKAELFSSEWWFKLLLFCLNCFGHLGWGEKWANSFNATWYC